MSPFSWGSVFLKRSVLALSLTKSEVENLRLHFAGKPVATPVYDLP